MFHELNVSENDYGRYDLLIKMDREGHYVGWMKYQGVRIGLPKFEIICLSGKDHIFKKLLACYYHCFCYRKEHADSREELENEEPECLVRRSDCRKEVQKSLLLHLSPSKSLAIKCTAFPSGGTWTEEGFVCCSSSCCYYVIVVVVVTIVEFIAVVSFIHAQQIRVKEYFIKLIPQTLSTWKVSPATKVS